MVGWTALDVPFPIYGVRSLGNDVDVPGRTAQIRAAEIITCPKYDKSEARLKSGHVGYLAGTNIYLARMFWGLGRPQAAAQAQFRCSKRHAALKCAKRRAPRRNRLAVRLPATPSEGLGSPKQCVCTPWACRFISYQRRENGGHMEEKGCKYGERDKEEGVGRNHSVEKRKRN